MVGEMAWWTMARVFSDFIAPSLNGSLTTSGGHQMVALGPILLLPVFVTLTMHLLQKMMGRM